jgi:hypothetical protein
VNHLHHRAASCALVSALTLMSPAAPAWAHHGPVGPALEGIADALAGYGFPMGGAITHIPEDDAIVREMTLYANRSYVFAIACDYDCDRATLQVRDENGNLVGAARAGNLVGRQGGDLPIVEVTPRWTGPFHLIATVERCETHVCEIGIATFGR